MVASLFAGTLPKTTKEEAIVERFRTLRQSDLVTNFFIKPLRALLIGVSKTQGLLTQHDETLPHKYCFRHE